MTEATTRESAKINPHSKEMLVVLERLKNVVPIDEKVDEFMEEFIKTFITLVTVDRESVARRMRVILDRIHEITTDYEISTKDILSETIANIERTKYELSIDRLMYDNDLSLIFDTEAKIAKKEREAAESLAIADAKAITSESELMLADSEKMLKDMQDLLEKVTSASPTSDEPSADIEVVAETATIEPDFVSLQKAIEAINQRLVDLESKINK